MKKYIPHILLFLVVAHSIIWSAVFAQEKNLMSVSFLDIGQGDAIYIKAPNGNDMLVDGGRDRKILSALGDALSYGDGKIDIVLATHPDADHIGGLPFVFDRYEVGRYVSNGATADTDVFQSLSQAVLKEKAPTTIAEAGDRIILDDSAPVFVDVLSPAVHGDRGGDRNSLSIVLMVTYGSTRFLLTGDAPRDVEDSLAKNTDLDISADVLKVAHHGSDSSTSDFFLSAVSPEYAVISVGGGNRYGHPKQSVLEKLVAQVPRVFRTDESGTVVCTSDSVVVGCK